MSNIPFIDIEGGGGGSDIQLSGPPIPTPNFGILSLGGGPFDGVTTGYFKGSANGTAIGVNLPGGSTSDLLNAQIAGVSAFKVSATGSPLALLVSPAATTVPLTVKGVSSQSANLQEWQRSTGTVAASVDQIGVVRCESLAIAVNLGIIDQSNSTPYLYFVNSPIPTIISTARAATQVPLTVKGAASQSANLQEWLSSTSAVLAKVDSSGAIAPQNGARITSGSGAPTTPGGINPTAGDVYHRTDTPTVANQRIYKCTVGGATPTWVGIA